MISCKTFPSKGGCRLFWLVSYLIVQFLHKIKNQSIFSYRNYLQFSQLKKLLKDIAREVDMALIPTGSWNYGVINPNYFYKTSSEEIFMGRMFDRGLYRLWEFFERKKGDSKWKLWFADLWVYGWGGQFNDYFHGVTQLYRMEFLLRVHG